MNSRRHRRLWNTTFSSSPYFNTSFFLFALILSYQFLIIMNARWGILFRASITETIFCLPITGLMPGIQVAKTCSFIWSLKPYWMLDGRLWMVDSKLLFRWLTQRNQLVLNHRPTLPSSDEKQLPFSDENHVSLILTIPGNPKKKKRSRQDKLEQACLSYLHKSCY